MVEPLACVVRGVEVTPVRPGDVVAVIGTGPIGLMFVELARLRGAHVVAAGRRPERLEKARALGADTLVTAEPGRDLAEAIRPETEGAARDLVIEAAGQPETAQAAVGAVRKGGS